MGRLTAFYTEISRKKISDLVYILQTRVLFGAPIQRGRKKTVSQH